MANRRMTLAELAGTTDIESQQPVAPPVPPPAAAAAPDTLAPTGQTLSATGALGRRSQVFSTAQLPSNINSRVFAKEDPLAKVHETFVKGDISGDGLLSEDEFVKIFMTASSLTPDDAKHLFKIFDEDESGSISWEEFAAAVYSVVHGDQSLKRKYAFMLFDRDLSGKISGQELRLLFKESLANEKLQVDDAAIDGLVRNALREAGDDDCSGDISFEEFEKWAERNPDIAAIKSLENLFSQWITTGTQCMRPSSSGLGSYVATAKKSVTERFEWLIDHYRLVLVVAVYTAISIGLFVNTLLTYATNSKYNAAVVLARIGGTQLHWNIGLCYVMSARMALALLEDHVELSRYIFDFHESITYHAFLGIAILYWAIIHTVAHLCNYSIMASANGTSISYYLFSADSGFGGLIPGWAGPTGFVLMVGFVPMALVAIFRRELVTILPKIFGPKADAFTVFFYTHLFYFAFLVLDLLHAQKSWKWLIAPMAIWIPDRLYQLFMATQECRIVSVQVLPGGVTRVEIADPGGGWSHSPGEYIFVLIPCISRIEFHPFTISSSALNTKTFTIHVRSLGDWTGKLHAFFKSKLTNCVEAGHAGNVFYPEGREAVIYVKGPYGAPMRGALRKPHVILVAGGIGVTPIASITSTLRDMHEQKQQASRIAFAGSAGTASVGPGKLSVSASLRVRDSNVPTAGEAFNKVLDAAVSTLETAASTLNVSDVFEKIKRTVTPSKEFRTQRVDVIWVNREAAAFGWFADMLVDLEERRKVDPEFAEFLNIRVFLTGFRGQSTIGGGLLKNALAKHVESGGKDLLTGLKTKTEAGRPDWDKILGDFKDRPYGDVSVLFCGPDAMARELHKACTKYDMDFKKEYF